jgi:polar amino acid transport system substrate-binding protein
MAGLLFLLGLPAHAAEAGCQIVIGSCHRPPLSTPKGGGIIDKLALEAFQRIGVTACIDQLPCERSLVNANDGVTDGDILRIPAVIAERFPNLLGVPEVLYALPMSGFVARPDIRAGGLAELGKLRVGHILGWKILEDQVHAASVLRVRGPEELFPLLRDDKVDLVIYERLTGLHLVDELGLKGIHALDPPLLLTPQYLVLHRRHQALVEPLATALRAMKADGSYAAAFRQAGYPLAK